MESNTCHVSDYCHVGRQNKKKVVGEICGVDTVFRLQHGA